MDNLENNENMNENIDETNENINEEAVSCTHELAAQRLLLFVTCVLKTP